MSEEDDLSAWGDALNEQAEAEQEASPSAAEDDPWGAALSEQAEASNNADEIDAASFSALEKGVVKAVKKSTWMYCSIFRLPCNWKSAVPKYRFVTCFPIHRGR